jgi:hypothetical protein
MLTTLPHPFHVRNEFEVSPQLHHSPSFYCFCSLVEAVRLSITGKEYREGSRLGHDFITSCCLFLLSLSCLLHSSTHPCILSLLISLNSVIFHLSSRDVIQCFTSLPVLPCAGACVHAGHRHGHQRSAGHHQGRVQVSHCY